jgi:hypothetical protein
MPVTDTQERKRLELEKREIFARLEKVVPLGINLANLPHAELLKRLERERERVEAQARDIERLKEIRELLWGRRSRPTSPMTEVNGDE